MTALMVGTGWYGMVRRRVLDSVVIFAVRRDWPDWRTHEFVSPRLTAADALRAAAADHAYWRRSPLRPRVSVVQMSANDFRIHRDRRDCAAPDCPIAALAASDGAVR